MTEDSETSVDQTLPEAVRKALASGYTLESIRLDGNGRWWHRGNPIEHEKIARLFSRSINRTEGGTWVLEVGPFTYPIEVADTPEFVSRVEPGANGTTFDVSLRSGRNYTVEPADFGFDERGLCVKTPEGFWARLERHIYLDFVEQYVEEQGGNYQLKVGDAAWPLRERF